MEDTETVAQSAPKPSAEKSSASNKKAVIVFVITLAVLAAGGFAAFRAGMFADTAGSSEENTAPEQSDVVAVVNGENLMRADFENRLTQDTAQYQQQGIDVTTRENTQQIQDQVLRTMVDEALLAQNALAAGIAPTETEVSDRYNSIAEQYGGADAFAASLAQQGVAQEQVRSDIGHQLSIEQYIASQVDVNSVTVTEEEARAAYDEAAAAQTGTTVPEYEAVAASIKQQVQQRKQNQLVSDFVSALREKSAIQILL